MTYSKQRLREVTDLKRQAVRRIQTDIGEIHPSPSRKYIQEFTEEFDTYESVAEPQEILDNALAAKLIWVGDYHALEQHQLYVVDLMRELARRKNKVAVA